MRNALDDLDARGMKALILDLRTIPEVCSMEPSP